MRLFVALDAPAAWQREAEAIQRALPSLVRDGARLVDLENLHVTLRFIGEVADLDTPRLKAALRRHLPPVDVELRLGRVGTFGAPARTSVVWLGVDGDLDGLRELHERANAAVEEALELPFDEGRFTPHITLARVRNRVTAADRRAIADHVRSLPPPDPEPFVAREALLLRSHLGPGGARYEVLDRYS